MVKTFFILLVVFFLAMPASECQTNSDIPPSLQRRKQRASREAEVSKNSNRLARRRGRTARTDSICGTIAYLPGAKGFPSRGISTGVKVYKDDVLVASAKSDSSGNYKVRSLPPGEYKIVVEEFEQNTTVIVKPKLCSRGDITIRAPMARPRKPNN